MSYYEGGVLEAGLCLSSKLSEGEPDSPLKIRFMNCLGQIHREGNLKGKVGVGLKGIRAPGERAHRGRRDLKGNPSSQHHPSNWVGAGDDDDDEDEDEDELYVQSTPK
ncbi:hypothetical protein MA16_Dca022448 [Dendrobium catenatum]|uniref:Uncharacterized protein n=1 Tax=Dendrobium catenatum TaxID=906689 RepID=A0A2I0VYZ6_9ASPA|nr:hypothetical protein MA16_Dca022448 [Dendrobium catenatum]